MTSSSFKPQASGLNLAQSSDPAQALEKFSLPQETGAQEIIEALYRQAEENAQAKKAQKALEIIQKIYGIENFHPPTVQLHAEIEFNHGSLEKAEILYRELSKAFPEDPFYLAGLGKVFIKDNRLDKAVNTLKQAAALERSAGILLELSKAELFSGDKDTAHKTLLEAAGQAPDYPEILYLQSIFFHDKDTDTQDLANRIESVLAAQEEPSENVYLYFGLSALYRKLKEPEKSFDILNKGCALKRKKLDYESKAFETYARSIPAFFTKDFIENFKTYKHESVKPVFIISMPRSGSTLLEQILSAHPDIETIGEDTSLGALIQKYSFMAANDGGPYPLRRTNDEAFLNFESIATEYINYLAHKKTTAPMRILNKAIGTRFHVGILHMIFPKAKFIHVTRNPMDCLFSCLTTNFTGPGQPYTYDMEELAHHHNEHVRLMRYWEDIIPSGAFKTVAYEDIVRDFETTIIETLNFIDMPWNDACAQFDKQKNPVSTASASQVRQPIYDKSIGRWKAYETCLEPLKKALDT